MTVAVAITQMPIEVGEASLTMGSKRPNARPQEHYEEPDASDPAVAFTPVPNRGSPPSC
jgi:hypothetical protein